MCPAGRGFRVLMVGENGTRRTRVDGNVVGQDGTSIAAHGVDPDNLKSVILQLFNGAPQQVVSFAFQFRTCVSPCVSPRESTSSVDPVGSRFIGESS